MFQLFLYYYGVYMYPTIAVQWNIYVQCGSHICSVKYIKYVYSAHGHFVDCSDLMWYINVYTSYL